MPFFKNSTPQQIKKYCEDQSLDKLYALNSRYGNFFKNTVEIEDRNNQRLVAIDLQISALEEEKRENREEIARAAEHRANILSNLPENPAEAYLARQQANYYVDDISFDLDKEIKKLEEEKINLNSQNALLQFEVHACIQELKIINAVIEEKKLAAEAKLEFSCQ